jgi:hypothetical protein
MARCVDVTPRKRDAHLKVPLGSELPLKMAALSYFQGQELSRPPVNQHPFATLLADIAQLTMSGQPKTAMQEKLKCSSVR